MHVLEVENLIRNYQKSALKKSDEDIKVLKGLNFSVEQGEFVGIMGKSGCGKTTLLKVLGMIDKTGRYPERADWLCIPGFLSDGQPVCGGEYHAAYDPGTGEGRRDDEGCQKVCGAVPDQPSAEEESL